jgi:hypothetical protein
MSERVRFAICAYKQHLGETGVADEKSNDPESYKAATGLNLGMST